MTNLEQMVPFTIPSRRIVSKQSHRGVLSTFKLEEVRDTLAKMAVLQEAEDYDRTLDQLHVDFIGGRMKGRFLTPKGLSEEELLFTETGAQGVAKEVLPPRFFSGLRSLAQMDEHGAKVASMAWAKFSSDPGRQDAPRMIRTVKMRVGEDVRRVVRSCHSQGYAPYSHLEFVEAMLSETKDFSNLPVLSWDLSDSAMRIRFAGVTDGEITLNTPIPMIEAWNSETGLRRVGLRGGMWKLVCTNGMGHWDARTEWNWIHRGDAQRIRDGVASAFQNLLVAGSGAVEAYLKAVNIAIDDAYKWMSDQLNHEGASQRIINAVRGGLTDPTTTPGGNLASVIDSITLIAQDETDVLDQYELERMAATIMTRGLAIGLSNNNRILLDA